MTWGSGAQRRADEFDALVAGRPAAAGDRDADLLPLVGALRAVPDAPARPEFVADLRSRLLAEAATALAPTPVDELDRLRLPGRRSTDRPGDGGVPRRQRRLAAAVGTIAVLGASTGVAAASQSALPGDALYPVKRALESAHVRLSTDEAGKGTTLLASARDRLDEVDALASQDEVGDDVRIAETLETFGDQAREGSDLLLADYTETADPRSVAAVHDFASGSLDRLADLEPLVPAPAHDALLRAAGTLVAIDREAGQRCPTCGGREITSIPGVLLAGLATADGPLAPAGTTAPGGSGANASSDQGAGGDTDGPVLPEVDAGQLGPATVPGPGAPSAGAGAAAPGAGAGAGAGATGGSGLVGGLIDPLTGDLTGGLGGLTGGLTGGATGGPGSGTSSGPSDGPSLPAVGDLGSVVGGVGGTLDDLVNGGPSASLPAPLG